jgi:hypothetical protein
VAVAAVGQADILLTENVLHRGSGMGGNYAKVDVTILCIPHKS